jgi:hypothetical protein
MTGKDWDYNKLDEYDKRVIAQLTDEESRLENFVRIFPSNAINIEHESYLNDLLIDYIKQTNK